MSQIAQRPLRGHWRNGDGRPLCLIQAPWQTLTSEQLALTPYCGACLHVLMYLGIEVSPLPWRVNACEAPDLDPNESLALLRGTPWEHHFRCDRVLNDDNLWWFQVPDYREDES